MSVLSAKVGAFFLLLSTSLVLGVLPFFLSFLLKRRSSGSGGGPRVQLAISCMQCLGGGVLLATVFTHMLPEIRESLTDALGKSFDFPLPEVLLCSGMFGIYLFEELGILCAKSKTDYKTMSPGSGDAGEDEEEEDRVLYDARQDSALLDTADRKYGLAEKTLVNRDVRRSDHGHSHSHINPAGTPGGPPLGSFRVLIVAVALSIHSVFEGMAIGLEPSEADAWVLTAAIATHKSIIAFCLGEQLASSPASPRQSFTTLLTFVMASPLGILLGTLMTGGASSDHHVLLTSTFQALAAGTILYVVMFEIIVGERAKPGNGLVKLAAVLVGFVMMTALVATVREPEEDDVDMVMVAALPTAVSSPAAR